MIEALVSGDDFDDEPSVADWFEAAVGRYVAQNQAATLMGTLAVVQYYVEPSEYETRPAKMVAEGIAGTDDAPLKRGIYLYEPNSAAVNYIELQDGSGDRTALLEELSAGSREDGWSGNVFGDQKTLTINARTGEALYGQVVDPYELEQWNTALLASVPVGKNTALLACKIAARRAKGELSTVGLETDKRERAQLAEAVNKAIKARKREQRERGIV